MLNPFSPHPLDYGWTIMAASSMMQNHVAAMSPSDFEGKTDAQLSDQILRSIPGAIPPELPSFDFQNVQVVVPFTGGDPSEFFKEELISEPLDAGWTVASLPESCVQPGGCAGALYLQSQSWNDFATVDQKGLEQAVMVAKKERAAFVGKIYEETKVALAARRAALSIPLSQQ